MPVTGIEIAGIIDLVGADRTISTGVSGDETADIDLSGAVVSDSVDPGAGVGGALTVVSDGGDGNTNGDIFFGEMTGVLGYFSGGLTLDVTSGAGTAGAVTLSDADADGTIAVYTDEGDVDLIEAADVDIATAGAVVAIDTDDGDDETAGNVYFTDASDSLGATIDGSGVGGEELRIDVTGGSVADSGDVRLGRVGSTTALSDVAVAGGNQVDVNTVDVDGTNEDATIAIAGANIDLNVGRLRGMGRGV
jgi:hypothetical protein